MDSKNEVFRIAKEIDSGVSNFKKDGPSRKTKSYFEKRKATLTVLQAKFVEADGKFREQSGTLAAAEEYKTVVEKTGKLVQWFSEAIDDGLRQINDYIEKNTTCDANTVSLETVKAEIGDNQLEGSSFFVEDEDNAMELRLLVKTQEGLLVNLQHQLDELDPEIKLSKELVSYRVDRLKRTFGKIEDMDTQIWALAKSTKAYGYDHQLFFSFANKVESIVTFYCSRKAPEEAVERKQDRKPKLPEITCPVFDGDYRQWYAFTELFKALIHSRTDIGSVEKMVYLQRNLSGEALGLVKNLALTEANYEAALKLLQDRYNNNRMIINAHLESILDRPNLTQQTASGLKGMHDDIKEALQALTRMKIDTDSWNPILHFLITRKLDPRTRLHYETQLEDSRVVPPIGKLLSFIQSQFSALEALGKKGSKDEVQGRKNSLVVTVGGCPLECGEDHAIHSCPKFKSFKVTERYDFIKTKNFCLNCLKPGHKVKECRSRSCLKCAGKHNTLLHFDKQPNDYLKQPIEGCSNDVVTNNVSSLVAKNRSLENYVILATVMVTFTHSGSNKSVMCRAILDSASQVTFVSAAMFNKLGIKGSATNIEVEGIGHSKKGSNVKTNLHLKSQTTNFSIELEDVIVLNSITSKHPNVDINSSEFEIPENMELADPEFYRSKEIGLLLGADIVGKVLTAGNISLGKNKPSLQNTLFGWVVIGEILLTSTSKYFCGIVTNQNDQNADQGKVLKKYWEDENGLGFSKIRSKENELCEMLFTKTVQRTNQGRFVVKLPFVKDVQLLGSSESMALKRFVSMERRLLANSGIRKQYCEFMKKYIDLGHMELVPTKLNRDIPTYYLPHHYVLKPSSTTTKLRVVFDAAASTTSNISLNDILAAGPKLQPDLFNILLRFRAYRYVLSGDIEMMYRQINVASSDSNYQLIFWRFDPRDRIQTYRLKTVTYGTTSAPYLAVKCMQTLALESSTKFPLASQTIMNDFYMDDLITGSDCLNSLNQIKKDVVHILEAGGFHLRKWCANNKSLLEGLPQSECETNFESNIESVKILGIHWKADIDVFQIKVKNSEGITPEVITKRLVLTKIAGMFDPLGIISPVLVEGKLLLQNLWALKLDWDEPLNEEMRNRWNIFDDQLHLLNGLQIPRAIFIGEPGDTIELHGFCDASKVAYGAVIYARSLKEDNIYVNLVCSKSRVVAQRTSTSIPRCELNAAVLLSKLMADVIRTLPRVPHCIQYYTDSTTVLHWIHKSSKNLNPYVARRVSIIQEKSSVNKWKYITSKRNPADIVSRGQSPKIFVKNITKWFEGPEFLSASVLEYDTFVVQPSIELEIEDMEKKVCLIAYHSNLILLGIDTRNDFKFLLGVMTCIIKFIYKRCNRDLPSNLSWKELAMRTICKDIQSEFNKEMLGIQEGKGVHRQSKLRTLSPFVDTNGLIRVGGRIAKAENLSFDARHPLVLSNKNPITYLLVKSIHETHLHVGPQALLYILRQNYWPIRGRMLTKRVVNNCYRCFKCSPRNLEQIMGNLPSDRLRFQRPFLVCGVDFIGPIKIHYKTRGKKPTKAYVCVFVCFATKAVHIEVVSDLTTNAFLAAFKRMIGRRGCPVRIYSDNGSNFKGAARQIEENIQSAEFSNELEVRNIEWKFIPARSPHMGGLWEAAVRSIKSHFERVVQNYTLDFEELQTLMIEIESVLNSRPLTPLSEDPDDFQVLSPGHFLIGEPFSSLPEPRISISRNFRNNWDALVALRKEFWNRWHQEYLSELQRRSKWNDPQNNIKVGSLVLLKDTDSPPLCWRRARVISCIRGDDKRVRVVELKTSNGVTKRSIHLVAPFPEEIQNGLTLESYDEESEDSIGTENDSTLDVKTNKVLVNDMTKNENKPNIPQNPSKNRRALLTSNFDFKTLFLFVLLFIPLAVSQRVFEPINDNSVLFYEDLGKSKVILTNFKLIAFFSLDSYWSARQGIKDTVHHLTFSCHRSENKLKETTSCEAITLQLSRKLNKFEKLHKFIFHNPRRKRAVLKFVGGLLHDITGVLDEDTANQYSQQIKENSENQESIVNMIKNMAALHNSTVNIMEENNAIIQKELSDVKLSMNSMKNILDHFSFDVMITKTLLAMEEFEIYQQSIWEAIRDVHAGIFNPTIIDPEQLELIIAKLRSQLPSSLSLPEANTFELFKLLKVKCSSSSSNIIFEISVPLIGTEEYTIFQVHAFPFIHEDKLIIVHPKVRFLLVNKLQDRYLEVEDENPCFETEKGWLCNSLNEVYHVKNTRSCEIVLFLGNELDSLKYCDFSIQYQHEIIKKLWTRNHWLVIEPSLQTFDIVCDNKRYKEAVQGRGIFKIQPGCQLKTTTSTIVAYAIESQNITFVTADLDWNLILNATTEDSDEDTTRSLSIELLPLKKYPKAPTESSFDLPEHEIHQFAISYTSLLLVILCGIGFIWLFKKFKNRVNKNPTGTLQEIPTFDNDDEIDN